MIFLKDKYRIVLDKRNITATKNLAQWKDLIVLAKTVEYYLINHQYPGVIKNEERGL